MIHMLMVSATLYRIGLTAFPTRAQTSVGILTPCGTARTPASQPVSESYITKRSIVAAVRAVSEFHVNVRRPDNAGVRPI